MRSRISWTQVVFGVIPTLVLAVEWGFWWGAVAGATLTRLAPEAWWAFVGMALGTTVLSLMTRTSDP